MHWPADQLPRGAPLLLTGTDSVPVPTLEALEDLAPSSIVVLGGEVAVARSVVYRLRQFAPVTRVSGGDRYATATAISRRAFPNTDRVLVATGLNYPDALAASARGAASFDPMPVLLVPPGPLPDVVRKELRRLAPKRITVVGGPAVIGAETVQDLGAFAGRVDRIFGGDRIETSTKIADEYRGHDVTTAFLASAFGFPDALAAAPVAGRMNGPVMLVDGTGTVDGVPVATLRALEPLQYVAGVGGATVMQERLLYDVGYAVNPSVMPTGQPASTRGTSTAGATADDLPPPRTLQSTTVIGGGAYWGHAYRVIGTPQAWFAAGDCDMGSGDITVGASASVQSGYTQGQWVTWRTWLLDITTGLPYDGTWRGPYHLEYAPGGRPFGQQAIGGDAWTGEPGHEYAILAELWRWQGHAWAGPQWFRVTPHRTLNGLRDGLSQPFRNCAVAAR